MPATDEVIVNSHSLSDQTDPAIVTLVDGGWVITWSSQNQDGSYAGIFGQVYNADGTPRGDEFPINTQTANSQSDPSVAALADGGWVVSWTSYNQDGSVTGIYGQAYNADGTARGGEFQINTTSAGGGNSTPPSSGCRMAAGWSPGRPIISIPAATELPARPMMRTARQGAASFRSTRRSGANNLSAA